MTSCNVISRYCITVVLALVPAIGDALPSFAQQTGQACAKCHVGAYGPQLKQYGRDFKLYGYANGDGQNWLPPISLVAMSSFTHTDADNSKPPPHFDKNDNTASVDKVKLAYGGALPGRIGTFSELTYDGVKRVLSLDNVDIRRAFNPTILGRDVVLGIDMNDRPTVQDLWNSTPTFEFLPNSTPLGPLPAASAVVDTKLAQRAVGLGGYMMWNNLVYMELTGYKALPNETVLGLGIPVTATTDIYDGITPYWRLAVQRDFAERHYFELGTYGIQADLFPLGKRTSGADHITDVAEDFCYQYYGSKLHYVSFHATHIHEDDTLNASRVLFLTKPADDLNTTRVDLSYSYNDKWTPTVEWFALTGSTDPKFYKTVNAGSPDSNGYVFELAYSLWGKPDSPVLWANGRLTLRYVAYTKFNGTTGGASDKNTLYLSVRFAVAPFGAAIKR